MHITSIVSRHGHDFTGSGDEPFEVCLKCAAIYRLVPDSSDPALGRYMASNGDAPLPCSGDTSMEHGYERPANHRPCNCVQCT